jgi:hypothetical protein
MGKADILRTVHVAYISPRSWEKIGMREWEEEELTVLFEDTPVREKHMKKWADQRIRADIQGKDFVLYLSSSAF